MHNLPMVLCTFVILAPLLAGVGPSVDAAEAGMEKVCEGLEFPEGPAYNGKDALLVSNCEKDYLTYVRLDGTVTRVWMKAASPDEPQTFKKTNGMTFFRDGSVFVCDHGLNAIVRISPEKRCEIYAARCDGTPFRGPNDLAFDSSGNLYFTDPVGSGKQNPVGAVYRVEHGSRRVTRVAEGMAFPNGLAFTADGKYLYVCESHYNRIVRFSVKADGRLGTLEEFADLSPDGDGEPDGMAVDTAGNLWVTHYAAHTLLQVSTEGKIIRTIRMPHDNDVGPTNVEFAGADLRMLYITDPGTKALWKMRVDTPGLALFCSPSGAR